MQKKKRSGTERDAKNPNNRKVGKMSDHNDDKPVAWKKK